MRNRYVIGGFILIGIGTILYVLYRIGFMAWFDPDALRTVVTGCGVFAPVAFVGAYILATVLFVPVSPLSLLGGALFGPLYGTLYVVLGATLGALGAFMLSRRMGTLVLRDGKGALIEKLQRYDERIAKNGFVTVLFLRLVPLFPFNGLNFALGLTKVRFRDYAIGTFIGIMPGTFAFVYFGDSLVSFNLLHIGLGLVFIILVIVCGKFISRRYSLTKHHASEKI